PLDPSLPVMPPGVVPTGAKVGIDATISEGIPHERYERISYAYADSARIADYLGGKADKAGVLDRSKLDDVAAAILKLIAAEPFYYQELAGRLGDYGFQVVARALGELHTQEKLWQTSDGKLCVRGSRFDAKPPGQR